MNYDYDTKILFNLVNRKNIKKNLIWAPHDGSPSPLFLVLEVHYLNNGTRFHLPSPVAQYNLLDPCRDPTVVDR
jgi:hypothetical protein